MSRRAGCRCAACDNFVDTRIADGIKSRWFELNVGIKVKIVWELWIGVDGRLMFAEKATGSPNLEPYQIPGFGFASRSSSWGLEYYIMYRIPFGKKNR